MPGPGIASATISVDLNGDRIPAEAAVLGREAGAIMGKEHSNAYEAGVVEGLTQTGRRLTKEFQKNGKDSAVSFRQAFEQDIVSEMNKIAGEVAGVFSDKNGFTKFRESLSGTTGELADVGAAVDDLTKKIQFLHSTGQLGVGAVGDNSMKGLLRDLNDLGDRAKTAEAEVRTFDAAIADLKNELQSGVISHLSDLASEQERVGRATQGLKDELRSGLIDHLGQMADEANRVDTEMSGLRDTLRGDLINHLHDVQVEIDQVHGSALQINQAFDSTRLKSWAADLGRAAMPANALQKEMGDLLIHLRDTQSAFDVGALGARDLRNEFDRVTPRVHVLADAMGLGEGAIRGIVSGAEDVGSIFVKLGDDVDQATGKTNIASKAFSGLKGVLSQMSAGLTGGGGLLGIVGIIGLVVAALGPLSVLTAAAGGGLTILGAAAFSAVGGLVAFYGIFSQITHLDAAGLNALPKQMRDTADAFQNLIGVYNKTTFEPGKLFTALKQGLADAFLSTKGLSSAMNTFANDTLPKIGTAIAPIGSALGGLFKQILTGLSSKNALSDIKGLVDEIASTLPRLGKTAGLAFGIIDQLLIDAQPFMHKFLDDTNNALSAFLNFLKSPKGQDAVTGWLENAVTIIGDVTGALAQAVDGIAKLAADPQQVQNTASALQNIGDSVPGLVALGDEMGPLIPVIFDLVQNIADMAAALGGLLSPIFVVIGGLQELHTAALIQLNAFANGVIHTVQLVGGLFADLGAILRDVANHDIGGLSTDLGKLTKDTGAAVAKLGTDIAAGFGNMSAIFDSLDTKSKTTLNNLTTDLGITGAAAKDAGGVIVTAAAAAGVGLSDLAGTTSINDLVRKLGLVGPAADDFRRAIIDDAAKSGTAFQLLDGTTKSSLNSLSTKLKLTGTTSDLFKEKITEMSHGNITKLQELAHDTSLKQVEATLGLTGKQAKAFESLFGSSMSGASSSSDGAKGHVLKFQQTVGELKNKQVIISQIGAQAATSQAAALASQLAALHDRQITISVNAQVNSKYAQGLLGNEFGGVVAGGQQIAGGRHAFAFGGLVNTPTSYGNVLAGEAGLEAIVPLTKPLDQVDKSVRQLAAYARGMGDGYGNGPQKVVNVNQNITVPTADPVAAAGYVVDRLVPRL